MIPIKSRQIFRATTFKKNFKRRDFTTDEVHLNHLATQTLRSEIRSRGETVSLLQQLSGSFVRDEARRASIEGRLARLLLEHDVGPGVSTNEGQGNQTAPLSRLQPKKGRGGIDSEADAAFGPDKAASRQAARIIETEPQKIESTQTLSEKQKPTRKVLIGGAISLIPADSLAPVSGVKHPPHPLGTVYLSEAAAFLTLLGTREQTDKKFRSTALRAAASVLNAACSGAFADASEPLASTKQLYLSLASCIGRGDAHAQFESSSALAAAVVQAWMRRVENDLNIEDRNRRETSSDVSSASRSSQKRFSVFIPSLEMLMGMATGMESLLPDVLFVTDHSAKNLEESSFELDLSSGSVQQSGLKRSMRSPAEYFKVRSKWWESRTKNNSEEFLPESLIARLAAGHVPSMLSPLARILSIQEWESLESRVLSALPDPSFPFLAIPVEVPDNAANTHASESMTITSSLSDVVNVKLSKNIDGSAYNSSGASNSALDALSSVLSLGGSSADSSPSIHKAFLNSTGATRDHYLDFLARMQRARRENSQHSRHQTEKPVDGPDQYPVRPLNYTTQSLLPQLPFFPSESTPNSTFPSLYPFVPSLSAAKRLANPVPHSSQGSILGLVRTPKAAAVNISAIAQAGTTEAAFYSGETLQSIKERGIVSTLDYGDDSQTSSFSVLPSYRSEQAHSTSHFRMLEATEAKDLGAVLALFFEYCSAEKHIDVLAIEIVVDACAKAGRSDIVFGLIWPFVMKSKIIPPMGLQFLFVKAASLSGDVDMALQLLEAQEDVDVDVDSEIFSKMCDVVMTSATAMQRHDICAELVSKAAKKGIIIN